MCTCRAALIEQHPDHLRHAALLHAVVENGSVALPQARQCATEAVGEINSRIVIPWMSRVPRRQQHPSAHVNLASPIAGEHGADHVQGLQGRIHVWPLCQRIRRLRHRLRQGYSWRRAQWHVHVHRRADDVTGDAALIVVVVIDIEHGLQAVTARRRSGERPGKDNVVRIDIDGRLREPDAGLPWRRRTRWRETSCPCQPKPHPLHLRLWGR